MLSKFCFLGRPTSRQALTGQVCAFLMVAITPAVSVAEPVEVNGAAPTKWSATFWSTQEYRLRNSTSPASTAASPLASTGTGTVRDQDLVLTLDGNVTGLGQHAVATLSAALWCDLDGPSAQNGQDVFGDARGLSQTMAVVYTASAEWLRSGHLTRLAVGRQQTKHGLPVTFDGAAVDLRVLERRLALFGFGGRTVHFFETRPGLFENWLVSGGAGLRLGEHLQIEADSRYLHESILGAAGAPGRRVNTNSYGLTAMGRWNDAHAKLFARGINHAFSHVGGGFHLQTLDADVGVDGNATAQLVTLGEIAESENPLYSVLGNSLPHLRARLETYKTFLLGEQAALVVAVGTRLRQLLHDEPTRFNRNTGALYARADVNDLATKGTFASALGEWNMPTQSGDSTRFFTVGGGLGYRSTTLKVEAGTYYQRFKINYYQDVEELANARTAYGMAALRVLPQLELRARYVVEILDRTIQSVYLTVREDL